MSRKIKASAPKRIANTRQAIAWVRGHFTPAQLKQMGHDSPGGAVLWWLANERVEEMLDGLSSRDMACMLVAGLKPLTLRDMDEEFRDRLEEEPDFDLTPELVEFFGVQP